MLNGHVFVLHADLADVAYDAVVLPTDSKFSVRDHWKAIGGEPKKSADFDNDHFTRGHGNTWWVDVTTDGAPDLYALQRNLSACLAQIGDLLHPTARVAVPVLGVNGGGLDQESGVAQARLLDTLRKSAETHQLDILLVARDEWRYRALQAVRLGDPGRWFPGIAPAGAPPSLDFAERLGRRARTGDLSLLLGAGVSIGAGLPDWSELVTGLGSLTQLPPSINAEQLAQLSPLDRAELLHRTNPKLAETVVKQLRKIEKPGVAHFLLAALGVHQVATTNYDQLYEQAVRSADPDHPCTVIPYERPSGGNPWLLKLHGDLDHPDDIVLTRAQFVAYNSRHRPAGALFQSMLLTSHLLVVGASFTDDNVLRLVHEVRDYLQVKSGTSSLGTVLTLHPEPARSLLWKGELDWVDVERDGDAPERVLDILLDAVAMYSCAEPASVLDERYDSQLGEQERDLAQRLRLIAGDVEKQGGRAWQGLKDAFTGLGYR
ncbi:SIR2 family protein [Yimella sp. cx-51]|uniref:SIR2 family protein n=1 Tax=Yimella sp. cx-51 TaxID=2770551 RepID=UPI00165DFAC5|nr:SIR2 family protein [Yimella sp. cx-51]MBC9957851.1 SIR2 family protein [Yimella sp. cx-51]QTH37988.1 SIR2 family protein [Yimella sp. cx-51]